jgi:hypothetical protein
MPRRHFVEVQLRSFLASALGAVKWSASRPGRFTPWESVPQYPVGHRASRDIFGTRIPLVLSGLKPQVVQPVWIQKGTCERTGPPK